jgi:hypothetical protein
VSTLDDLCQHALAAVSDGACQILVSHSRARLNRVEPVAHVLDQGRVIVKHHDDGSVTLVWDEHSVTSRSLPLLAATKEQVPFASGYGITTLPAGGTTNGR